MSKPEHTESPEPSVGAGSPAAKPGPAPTAPGSADPSTSASAAGDPDPAKPAAAKPAAKGPDPAKSAAGKSSAAADASAEPEDAKPAGAAKPAAEPAAAKPAAKGSDSAKPAAGKSSAAADASAEPEDAKPAANGLDLAKPAPGKSSAEAQDAKPAASKGAGKAAPATPATPVKGKASNPVTEKADAVAAEVKARAEAAKAAGNGQDKGRLLAGRYRLGAVLGKGGMGTVWRAEDEILGRTVAVKELRFSTGVDEDEKRRLITRTLREAKAIARIRSGGAVTVYDVVDEDGRPWIVMELIEGPSLAEFIRERGTLTPRRAAEVGLAVLDVLRAAHGQGILHRDVKPSNVLIAGNGRVILTDFGIAQVEGDPSVTSTGMLVGAPSYISPERARGQRPGPPADMWSLGGLLYAAVEGVPPYDKGSALATLTAVMTEPVDPPKNAGPLLTEVIYGLLVKDPARRLDDERARAMLTAVINAPDEPEPAPEPVPSPEETRQISLVEAKQAAEKIAEAKAEKKERERREREQRERARAALKAARKAAAVPAASAAAAPAVRPGGPIAASLTDVMPRRTIALAIAGVIVVLAVIGSLVVYAFSGDDKGGKNEGKGGATPSASGSASTGAAAGGTAKGGDVKASADPKGGGGEASPGQSPGNQQSSQGQTQGQSQGQTQGQGGGGDSQGQGAAPGTPGGTLPAGYATVTDPRFHFSMAMPEGFHQTDTAGENSGAIYSRDGGFPRIQVDFNGSPLDDARAAWASLAPAVAGSSKNYKVIRIESVKYRDYPTVADWEFERDQKGIRVRVLNRGFKADAKHGYAIMISCPAADWDGAECTQMRTTAFETFQILG
ncbi:serine/threonine-protein kinase [Streptomyces goshikiensis]|uniref:serine/threonine-protein kinase n=1 Tax=Streptomyces goshikiensis TaxID=1942 RepID=UPI0036B0CACA